MQIIKYPPRKDWEKIISRPVIDHSHLYEYVKNIFDDVRQNGDMAVADYCAKFDNVVLDNFLVAPEEFDEAEKLVTKKLKEVLTTWHGKQKSLCIPILRLEKSRQDFTEPF